MYLLHSTQLSRFYTVNDYSPLYRQMLFFHKRSSDKIYNLKLYHLLNVTLHSKANVCNIGTLIRFYMQMRVEQKTKHLPIDSIGHSQNSVFLLRLLYVGINGFFF